VRENRFPAEGNFKGTFSHFVVVSNRPQSHGKAHVQELEYTRLSKRFQGTQVDCLPFKILVVGDRELVFSLYSRDEFC
jgi:hypothetical protein